MRTFGPILIVICFCLFACKNKPAPETSTYNNTSLFLLEHVPGSISVQQDIFLRFKKEVPQEIKDNIENYIRINPRIKASYTWQKDGELIINPDSRLPHGKAYTLSFDPISIFGFESDPIHLNFKTKDLKLNLVTGSVRFDFDGTKDLSYLSGSIEANDFMDRRDIEKMLSAQQSGNKNIEIEWAGPDSGKDFPFSINGIEKQSEDSELVLTANGTKWDEFFKTEKKFNIQAKGQFKLTEIKPIDQSQSYISVFFSEPLQKTQNLKGLITTEKQNTNFKTEIIANEIRLYPEAGLTDNVNLVISKKIKNYRSENLPQDLKHAISLSLDPPQIRLLGNGVITPIDNEVVFPFEGKNLNAVDVEIFKIYEDNVLQFLQYNPLDGNGGLHQVGKIIYQDSIPLDRTYNNTFERFYIDIKQLVDLDPGSIYQIRLGFRKHYALLKCDTDHQTATLNKDGTKSILEVYSNNYQGYEYKHRKDPCYPAFYNQSKFIKRNVLPSNIGLIAKSGPSNKLSIACTDLKTTEPLNGVELIIYNYQQQELARTNSSAGAAELVLNEKPNFIIAKYQNQYGYLNLQDYNSNSMTEFEVQGKSKHKSLDGYIYGERGVWRPGDTLFLSFMLEDLENTLPTNHPVQMTVKDSRGSKKFEQKTSENQGGIYVFKVPTSPNDPTGNWSASINIGKRYFSKTIKVETVKPNL